jgi:hypothetical protein
MFVRVMDYCIQTIIGFGGPGKQEIASDDCEKE